MKSPTTVTHNTLFLQLTAEEYAYFCDLIICSSEMSEYLLTTKSSSQIARKHAQYCQQLLKKFKPLLKNTLKMAAGSFTTDTCKND